MGYENIMKKLAAIILAVLTCTLYVRGQTNVLFGNLVSSSQSPRTNVLMTAQRLSPKRSTAFGDLVSDDPISTYTDTTTNAGFSFTNCLFGRWNLTASDSAGTPWTFYVGSNTLGYVPIASLITNSAAVPPNPGTNYYTIAQLSSLPGFNPNALTNNYASPVMLRSNLDVDGEFTLSGGPLLTVFPQTSYFNFGVNKVTFDLAGGTGNGDIGLGGNLHAGGIIGAAGGYSVDAFGTIIDPNGNGFFQSLLVNGNPVLTNSAITPAVTNLFAYTNESRTVTFTNPANQFTGTFNGAGSITAAVVVTGSQAATIASALQANQTITVSGDYSTSGSTALSLNGPRSTAWTNAVAFLMTNAAPGVGYVLTSTNSGLGFFWAQSSAQQGSVTTNSIGSALQFANGTTVGSFYLYPNIASPGSIVDSILPGAFNLGGQGNVVGDGNSGNVGGLSNSIVSGVQTLILGGVGNVDRDTFGGYVQGINSLILAGGHNRLDGTGNIFSNSVAGGYYARARHTGVFVWADSSANAYFDSTAANQFIVRATNGVAIGTNNPSGYQFYVFGPANINGPLTENGVPVLTNAPSGGSPLTNTVWGVQTNLSDSTNHLQIHYVFTNGLPWYSLITTNQ